MYVDALTLAAIADEWRALLTGARIDTIIQPTEYAIALQCYTSGGEGQPGRNSWLYLSAHPQLARAHLTALKPPKIASEPPPFVMLLRKHLEGARIESIVQPRWERVLEIVAGYRKSSDSDERTRFRLIIEIMGRLSNIILVDEQGMILGSLRRVGAEVNRYRTIAANIPYLPPPPQQRMLAGQSIPRLEPTIVTAAQLAISAAEKEETELPAELTARRKSGAKQTKQAKQPKLWQLLTRHLLGFSPLSAQEAVFRTTGNVELALEPDSITEETWEELAWNVRSLAALYDAHAWQPQLVERVEQSGGKPESLVPVAFAPYLLEQYAEAPQMRMRSLPSMNAALDEFYARAEWRDAMEDVRAPIRKALQTHLERGRRKADLLQQELVKTEEAAQYRLQAELLLAHQHEVQQGHPNVSLPNFYAESDGSGNQPIVIVPLDPRFDAVGNANRLFNRYHKLRRATELVPAQIEQNAVELATIEQLLADLMLAETPAEVALVKAEVQMAGYMRGAPKQQQKAQKQQKAGKKGGKQGKGKPTPPGGGVPLHVQSREGFTLLIGKNSRQNEDVTFHQAAPNDLWLHARGVPGAHVIIKAAGREIPRATIEQAARLAAYYSQARGSTSVPVDYTLQRHIRHMKGGGPGMVIYERERTIYVEPKGVQE